MVINVSWPEFKAFALERKLSIQWVQTNNVYYLAAIDGPVEITAVLPFDSPAADGSDQQDFETNYKSSGNKSPTQNSIVQASPPYGSKTIVVNGTTKKLYARNVGSQYDVIIGTNTLTYTATYAWAKMLGVEAINCSALDTVDFKVLDDSNGTYSGHPNLVLQQFAYTLNLPKDYYQRFSQFDADIYAGMVIQMTYNSVSNKTIAINFLLNEVK